MALDLVTTPIGQLGEAIKSCVRSNTVLVILGPPGCGKTQIVAQVGNELGMQNTELLVAGRDTSDVMMSYVNPANGRLEQKLNPKVPYIGNPAFNETQGILCNIDEITGGNRLMQNFALKLLDERLVGDVRLRDDVRLVATGNRAWDMAHVEQMSAALANRATFVTVEPDLEAFIEYGIRNGFHPLVLAWVKNDPTYLSHFDSNQFLAGDPAFCSPRANERLSNILHDRDQHGTSDSVFRSLVCGTIGNAIGIKFVGWSKIQHELPDCDAIAQGDKTQRVPKDPAVVYAVIYSLLQRCTKTSLVNILSYVERLQTEWHAMFITTFSKVHPTLVATSTWGNFIAKH